MQLISLGTQYAITSLIILGREPVGTAMSAADLAKSLESPSTYLSQILAKLNKPGIVGSRRGLNGGVYLRKKPEKIRLIDIIEAIDGSSFFETCFLGIKGCGDIEPCPFHEKWGEHKSCILFWLEETTLQNLCDDVTDSWILDRMKFDRKGVS